MSTGSTRCRVGWLMPVAMALLVCPALAQMRLEPPDAGSRGLDPQRLARVQIDPEVLALTLQLASDSFEQRDEATKRLLEAELDSQQLLAVLAREPLDSEQRHRLLEVIRHQLVNMPRGALGIRMLPRQGMGAGGVVEVVELLPGLPARQVLQIGDRIIAIDGVALERAEDLRELVQSHRPGEEVDILLRRVRRDEAGRAQIGPDNRPIHDTLEVQVPLGSVDQLADPDDPRGAVQESAVLQSRRMQADEARRRFAPAPEPISVAPGPRGTFETARLRLDDDLIDQHPSIQMLRRQKEYIEAGHLAVGPELRAEWQRRLKELRALGREPELSPEHRAYVLRVAERFEELLGE